MSDKILNINDFKKKENASESGKTLSPQKPPQLRTPYIRPDEMNPDDIQIEDPMNFLSSEEKQEYIRAHQETFFDQNLSDEVRKELSNQREDQYNRGYTGDIQNDGQDMYDQGSYDGYDQNDYDQNFYDRNQYDDGQQDQYKGAYVRSDNNNKYQYDYSDEIYRDQADFEEYEEESEDVDDKMPIITKILAAITAGLIIIIFAAIIYGKFNDPANESDVSDDYAYTDTTSEDGDVSGTTVYTTNDLNLRTSPEKTQDNVAMTVTSGTKLILVGEENGWAKVYYEGQYYYCSKDYITETK
mgnify:FL=1